MFLKSCYYLNSLHKSVTFPQTCGRSYTRSYSRPYTFLQTTGRSYKLADAFEIPLQHKNHTRSVANAHPTCELRDRVLSERDWCRTRMLCKCSGASFSCPTCLCDHVVLGATQVRRHEGHKQKLQ